ncbi:MAG: hypothetical protein IJU95_04930, partial [Treponema sp.]|nr:hypothetical protein [Treponema sp.]
SSYSDGEIYNPGSSSSSSSSFSSDDILTLSNAGDTKAIVQLCSVGTSSNTTGSGGTGGIFDESNSNRISFLASKIGLPSGGSVTLTLTSGSEQVSYTATASSDGYVYFDVPAIKTGSTVTAKMDIRNSSNTLVLTGSAKETISTSSNNLDISLSDKMSIPVTTSFSEDFFMFGIKDETGVIKYYYPGSTESFKAKIGSTIQYMGLKLDQGGSIQTTGNWQDFTVTDGAELEMELEAGGSYYYNIAGNCVSFSFYHNWMSGEIDLVSSADFYMPPLCAAKVAGLLTIEDVTYYLAPDDVTATLITPTDTVSDGEMVKAYFKLKIGGVTSAEFDTNRVAAETHA